MDKCDGDNEDSSDANCEDSEEVKRAKLLELQAVKVAESGNLVDSLDLLNKAVAEVPDYASVYNNRAQVYKKNITVQLLVVHIYIP